MTKVYGHRGCKGTYPENTLLGFRQAIEHGVDGIELDIHMTKDGEIVVIHDESLDRTTDGTGYIKDLTLEEIKQFSAGNQFTHLPNYQEGIWSQERVPTLKEVLELLVPYPIDLNIEFKTYMFEYEGIESKVHSIVSQFGGQRKVIYSSFYLPTILKMKKINPEATIALLLHNDGLLNQPNYLQNLPLSALNIAKDIVLSNSNLVKSLNYPICVWTVNKEEEIKQLLEQNVETIISDFPEKVLHSRNERKLYV
ncbi:glycerophosphodiester phosphodiesterase [Heyndrickxia oleronia]|uniref:glycerophosphodiester phosphodiesterase n=1 Tax=Heyndrickxia oleronia TaxID=38875 RepID=UPI00204184E8|nr:glycerophosphodiester phosphodiesterase [Heyndrickxia oleronia]MCM3454976.1 glycerophosphodiester phosphodiesterase [Heyndrickxia oleronia]